MDIQTEDSDFIGPSIRQGSKKSYFEQKSVTLFEREKIIVNQMLSRKLWHVRLIYSILK